MECLAAAGSECVAKGVNWLIGSSLTEADYAWNCKKYVADLRGAVAELKKERDSTLRRKRDDERRGKTITSTVNQWLEDTEKFIQNAEKFLTPEDRDSPKTKCCVVMCPNCKARVWVSMHLTIGGRRGAAPLPCVAL